MSGWKTWAGAAIMGLSVAITELGYPELGDATRIFGMALLGVGVAHKIEKAAK